MTTLPRSRPLTRADLDTMPDDGHYLEVARIHGDESWTATQPFEVTVCPADLVR